MIKGGDKAISTVVRRSSRGLELTVQLHESVAEFMRVASGEETSALELFGRKWQTPTRLDVYNIPESMKGTIMVNSTTSYRLDRPGQDLYVIEPSGVRMVNMSFLRLVGASHPGGITFSVAGAYEKDDVIWFAQVITEAGNIFCKKYIYPMIISTSNTIRPEVGLGIQEAVHQP